MKIVKEGKMPPKPLLYSGTCNVCGCHVEAEPKEVIYHSQYLTYVNCPTKGCNKCINMSPIKYEIF
jgi:hypothetical protein